jgi:diaminohydroxyphosphoribosylaminopyrimidine deaminase/5-amino-6-(5-phosphoribosylamino)uracil reductase
MARQRGARRDHEHFMGLALRLARKGLGRTSPNPAVGAVVTRGDEVVGRGYHRRAGTRHAEITAIQDAGALARGATLYVNLEPCNHHGRTGPCAHAIVEARIRRVVIGMRDPNPLVNGRGIAALRRRGIEVVTGVLEQECRRLNEAFVCYITRGRPFVTFKAAVTLDGHVAARGGDSRWVTGEAARLEGHRLRNTHDAIVVGVGTVLADDPELTCRGVPGGRDPVRVVVDSRLRTPPTAKVVAAAARSSAPTIIATTASAPERRARQLERAGARVIRGRRGPHVNVDALLAGLGRLEIASVLLEGGPTLAGAFWRAGLVDRVVAFVAPKVLADPGGLPMVVGEPVRAMAQATALEQIEIRKVGEDVLITGLTGRGRCSRG